MASVLVVFEGRYGQSAKIAEHVAEVARRRGHAARAVFVDAAHALDLRAEDAVAVVAPVYFSRHPAAIEAFVRSRADLLDGRPSAFFSVSGSAGGTNAAARAKVEEIGRAFLARTRFEPRVVAFFGGAIAYPRYNFLLRAVMRAIAKRNGEPTDTSKINELTDWDAVDRAATTLLDALEPAAAARFSLSSSA